MYIIVNMYSYIAENSIPTIAVIICFHQYHGLETGLTTSAIDFIAWRLNASERNSDDISRCALFYYFFLSRLGRMLISTWATSPALSNKVRYCTE